VLRLDVQDWLLLLLLLLHSSSQVTLSDIPLVPPAANQFAS